MPLDSDNQPRTAKSPWLHADGSFNLPEIMKRAHMWARKEVAGFAKMGMLTPGQYARSFKNGLRDFMGFAREARAIFLRPGLWREQPSMFRKPPVGVAFNFMTY